jgi:4-hydroxy-tetrahydrodipicolinate synthase
MGVAASSQAKGFQHRAPDRWPRRRGNDILRTQGGRLGGARRISTADLATLGGYVSALPTPFDMDAIDVEAFESICDWQIEQGISALVVNGTTGEASTLTLEEGAFLIQVALEVSHGRVPVIAGAGSNSTAHAIEIALMAQKAGANGLLAVTPYYNRPSQEGLFRHFSAVHDATALPVLLYDVPARTGCELAIDTICRLAELPRIAGLKDAAGDCGRPQILRRKLGERFRLLGGDDNTAVAFLTRGGNGCISVLSNVVPKLCQNLFLACAEKRLADAALIEQRLKPLVTALFAEANPIPLKWAMALMGRMSPQLRLPLCLPAEPTRKAVQSALVPFGREELQILVRSAQKWRFSPDELRACNAARSLADVV